MTLNHIIEYAKVNNIPFDEELVISSITYDNHSDTFEPQLSYFRDIALTTNSFMDKDSIPKVVLINSDVSLYDRDFKKLRKIDVQDFVNERNFEEELKSLRKSPVHPMRTEFVCWILDSIKERLGFCNYPEMTQAMHDDLYNVCVSHTNKDYEECSDSLTKALEKCLIQHGIKENDAIRMSWKWSD